MSRRMRLDALVVERGLADTRARAKALVLAGQVRVNDVITSKAGAAVATDARVTLIAPDHPYVGRGGIKLAHALDTFGIAVRGWTALDIGASTGGFTDALLQHGARRVAALDVGRGQLAWTLRQDARVVPLEGINARHLEPMMLPTDFHHVDLVTIDVSFISLTRILPRVPPFLRPHGHAVVLVKPQFEAGRSEVGKKGLVTDPNVHRRVIDHVAASANEVGLEPAGVTPSPITGAEGNQEFFLHLRRSTSDKVVPRQ